jgi:hydroxyacylglutathione hydrolase
LRALSEEDVKQAATAGAVVIDTRSAPFFGAGHFPGSLNIGLGSAMFSTWVGFLVPGDSQIVLVLGAAANAEKARLELARIGFDNVLGFIEADALTMTRQVTQLGVCDLKLGLQRGDAPLILDVRTPGEWSENHLDGSLHVPLPMLPKRASELPKDEPVAVMCGSGYRSSIAASLLLRGGHRRLANVMGGMSAYSETKCSDMAPADLVFSG